MFWIISPPTQAHILAPFTKLTTEDKLPKHKLANINAVLSVVLSGLCILNIVNLGNGIFKLEWILALFSMTNFGSESINIGFCFCFFVYFFRLGTH